MAVNRSYEEAPESNELLDGLYERLCENFRSELARQRSVLEACREQSAAAVKHDIPALERATGNLVGLMEGALTSESERIAALRALVDAIDLPEDKQTLTDLIGVSPEPWRSLMGQFQVDLRTTLEATQASVRSSASYFRHAGRVLDGYVDSLVGPAEGTVVAYGQDGNTGGDGHRPPALINTAG